MIAFSASDLLLVTVHGTGSGTAAYCVTMVAILDEEIGDEIAGDVVFTFWNVGGRTKQDTTQLLSATNNRSHSVRQPREEQQ